MKLNTWTRSASFILRWIMESLSMRFVMLPRVVIPIFRISSARSVLIWRAPPIKIFLLSRSPLIIVFLLRKSLVGGIIIPVFWGPPRFMFHLLIVSLVWVPPSVVIWAPRMRPIIFIYRTISMIVSILLRRFILIGAFFSTFRICFSSGRRRNLKPTRNQQKKNILLLV